MYEICVWFLGRVKSRRVSINQLDLLILVQVSYLDIFLESLFRIFFIVNARMIELMNMIFGHFGIAWLFDQPTKCGTMRHE